MLLDDGQAGDHRTCTTDTRYALIPKFENVAVGTKFCVLTSQRVALVEVRKAPDPDESSQYYQLAITIWRVWRCARG
ncbi:hypothetical protein [Actinokineospora sp.]|uniref:hypothetical protein n=1 Tax=Actinokineospora sp. TaxID=1872133 RepID=UPI003D6BB56D